MRTIYHPDYTDEHPRKDNIVYTEGMDSLPPEVAGSLWATKWSYWQARKYVDRHKAQEQNFWAGYNQTKTTQ